MRLLKSLIACFSTYSRIPMPVTELDSDDMKYALLFFPVIGALIGNIEYLVFYITGILLLPHLFRVLIMTAIPLIITGGIHVDGFMDTSDAFSSYGDKEKKLSIMKDPHTGAFAVIRLALYGLLFIAFSYIINEKSIVMYCYSFVISRALSSISVVTIKDAKSDGMIHDIKKNTNNKIILMTLLVMCGFVFLIMTKSSIIIALSMLIISVISYFVYKRKMLNALNGITGDTSGYYLCVVELILIVISSVGGYI